MAAKWHNDDENKGIVGGGREGLQRAERGVVPAHKGCGNGIQDRSEREEALRPLRESYEEDFSSHVKDGREFEGMRHRRVRETPC